MNKQDREIVREALSTEKNLNWDGRARLMSLLDLCDKLESENEALKKKLRIAREGLRFYASCEHATGEGRVHEMDTEKVPHVKHITSVEDKSFEEMLTIINGPNYKLRPGYIARKTLALIGGEGEK